MRVLAVTPTYGNELRPQMRASMQALQLDGIDLTWQVLDDNPWPAPDHRNVLHMYRQARRRALAGRYDVLWTVEHDMVLHPDAALHLNATPGDVVYGVYIIRFGTEVLSAFGYVDDQNMGDSLSLDGQALETAIKHTVVRVSGTGWGCTWIRREALKAIPFPEEWPENPPFDIAFSHQCIRKGLRLYANMRVQCGHIKGDQTLWPAEFHREVEHSPQTWLIDGQRIHQYRLKRSAATQPASPARLALSGLRPMDSVRLRALRNVVVRVDGQSVRLHPDQQYEVPARDVDDIVRGGYAEVVGVP
jgi:hypothetical protein